MSLEPGTPQSELEHSITELVPFSNELKIAIEVE